ncbi:MAG: glycosyltransferase, partial [Anaerolineae bacterium]
MGTLDNRVDVALLQQCARQLPHVSFALVGAVKKHLVDLNSLTTMPNVYLSPPCQFADVPAKVAAFDVGLIPYYINRYTKELSPIKLYEYLALAKPVVATNLPYLAREAAHIRLADTAVSFIAQLETVVSTPPTTTQKVTWRQAALDNSWRKQVNTIEETLQKLQNNRERSHL